MNALKNMSFILLALTMGGCAEMSGDSNQDGDLNEKDGVAAVEDPAGEKAEAPDSASDATEEPTLDSTDIDTKKSMTAVIGPATRVDLAVSATTVAVNGLVTLTATTNIDVGPTRFWIELYDVTTNSRLYACGYGSSCTTTVSEAVATTHSFVAYLAADIDTFPPTDTAATSTKPFVTWGPASFTVSLPPTAYCTGSSTSITATSNIDVGPTPYSIVIFNTNGSRIGSCGYGKTCSLPVGCSNAQYVAFVAAGGYSLPPATTLASSNLGKVNNIGIR